MSRFVLNSSISSISPVYLSRYSSTPTFNAIYINDPMNNPIFISSFVILFAFIYLYERGERSATTFSKFSRASEKGLQLFLQCFDILRDQRGHTVFIFAHIDSGHRFFNSVPHLRSVQENFMQSRQALSNHGRFRIIEKRHHLIEHRIDLAIVGPSRLTTD